MSLSGLTTIQVDKTQYTVKTHVFEDIMRLIEPYQKTGVLIEEQPAAKMKLNKKTGNAKTTLNS